MKIVRYITLAVIMAALLPAKASAKGIVMPKGYLFGFVANFTDSVVYFTDIQAVDSVWYDTKKKFLLGRDIYANQLRNYFAESLKMPHRTCIVSFALTRKDAEKKLVKMRKLYTEKNAGSYEIRNLNENEFKFNAVSMEEQTSQEVTKTKAERKAEKKAAAEEKEKRKQLAKSRKGKKELPPQKPLNPNLPPAEVEMRE